MCQVWLKMVQWFWRRRFLNFVNVFSPFRNYLPLEKGGALHLNKLESFYPRMLCANYSLRQRRRNNDDDGQRTNFDQKSLIFPLFLLMW